MPISDCRLLPQDSSGQPLDLKEILLDIALHTCCFGVEIPTCDAGLRGDPSFNAALRLVLTYSVETWRQLGITCSMTE